MSRQAYVSKDIPITEIRRVKRDLQKFVDLYNKVTFIEDLYEGASTDYLETFYRNLFNCCF